MGKGRFLSRIAVLSVLSLLVLGLVCADHPDARTQLSTVDMWGIREGKLARFANPKPALNVAQTETLNVSLIGRALFVYWPAGFRVPAPIVARAPVIPNVGRMRLIR